ncbi:hypothetical protein FRC03_012128 [Tulasnella sp. 419]|nr:hypothetical protein FRC03_012128 [Tulasnella sp. 419]
MAQRTLTSYPTCLFTVPMSGTKAMEVLSAVAPPDIGEPALSPSTLELDRQVFNDNDYRANVCIV